MIVFYTGDDVGSALRSVRHYIALGAELDAKRCLWSLPKRVTWRIFAAVRSWLGVE